MKPFKCETKVVRELKFNPDNPFSEVAEKFENARVESMKRLFKKHMDHPLMKEWHSQHCQIKGMYKKSFAMRDELLNVIEGESNESK